MGGTRVAVALSFAAGLLACFVRVTRLVPGSAHGPVGCDFNASSLLERTSLDVAMDEDAVAAFLDFVVVAPDAALVEDAMGDLSELFSQLAALQLFRDALNPPVSIVEAGGAHDSSPLGLWQSFLEGNAVEVVAGRGDGVSGAPIFAVEHWLASSVEGVIVDVVSDVGDASDAAVVLPVCSASSVCEQRPFSIPAHRLRRTLSCCEPPLPSAFTWWHEDRSNLGDCLLPESAPASWPCATQDRRVCRDRSAVPGSTEPWSACLVPWPRFLTRRSTFVVLAPSEAATPLYFRGAARTGCSASDRADDDAHMNKYPPRLLLVNGRLSSDSFVATRNDTVSRDCPVESTLLRNFLRLPALSEPGTGTASVLFANNNISSANTEFQEAVCRHVIAEVVFVVQLSRAKGEAIEEVVCSRGLDVLPMIPLHVIHDLERALAVSRYAAAHASLNRACSVLSTPGTAAPHHVDFALRSAWERLQETAAMLSAGEWVHATSLGLRAAMLAEAVLASSEVASEADQPLWHIAAITAPPWAPLIVPVTIGVLSAVREARRRRNAGRMYAVL